MASAGLARYDFIISRRRYDPTDTLPEDQANAYFLWRFDPDSDDLLSTIELPGSPTFDRRHSLVQIGNYLLEWGPIQNSDYGGTFPYRLFMFDPNNGDPS